MWTLVLLQLLFYSSWAQGEGPPSAHWYFKRFVRQYIVTINHYQFIVRAQAQEE